MASIKEQLALKATQDASKNAAKPQFVYVLESSDPWESEERFKYQFQGCLFSREEAEAAPIPEGEGRLIQEINVANGVNWENPHPSAARTAEKVKAWFDTRIQLLEAPMTGDLATH